MLQIDWGSVPDWLQGVGGIVALFFAAWAVRVSMATNAQQTRQIAALERAEQERSREVQARYASNVACWVTVSSAEENRRVAVRIVNSNEVPVYEAAIYAGTDTGSSRTTYQQIGPTADKRRLLGRPSRALQQFLSPYEDGQMVLDSNAIWTAMTFRDSNDRWWCRDPRGMLIQASSEEEATRTCREAISRHSGLDV